MFLRGDQAARFSEKPTTDIWAVLIFGEDEGVNADVQSNLIKAWSANKSDVEIITLDEDRVRKENAILRDQLQAVSLLGADRIIRLRTNGDKLAKLLIGILGDGDDDAVHFAAKLIIQAGALKKTSKLRGAAEKAKRAAALQLFADDAANISALISNELKIAGAEIDAEALSLFAAHLPGHRAIARREIEKLALYAHNLGRPINLQDIRSLGATDVDHALSEAIIATFEGRVSDAHSALSKLSMANITGISILRALERETIRMLDAHAAIAAGGAYPGMKLRPPVFNNQWPAFRQRLSKWPGRRLHRILERLYDAEQQVKSSGTGSEAIVRMLMNDLVRVAETV